MNKNNGLKRIVTISFSGAGHLLPYHLGAATVLMKACGAVDSTATKTMPLAPGNTFRGLRKQEQDRLGEKTKNDNDQQRAPLLPPIKAVAGSSSGSIAAALMAYLPHKMEEYADKFIREGGHAYQIFERMILAEEEEREKKSINAARTKIRQWELYVCGTRCTDGELCLFPFNYNANTAGTTDFNKDCTSRKIMTSKMFECVEEREYLFKAIQASCKIPVSFHPIDMISWPIFGASKLNYDEDGIQINDQYYCDGGIVAPAPPTPYDFNTNGEYYTIHNNEFDKSNCDPNDNDNCSSNSDYDNMLYHNNRIIVTPIESFHRDKNTQNQSIHRISPNKNKKSSGIFNLRCRGDFSICLSAQNVHAFGNSMGGNADQDTLRHWYQRGKHDTEQFVKEEEAKQNSIKPRQE